MKKVLFAIVLLLLSQTALAAGFKTENECKAFSDAIIDQFIQSNFQKGLDEAKKYWPLPGIEIDGMANQINQQWPVVAQRFGKSIEKEFIRQEKIGNSFLRYYYLHKFENHAIYWKIDYYKPHDLWKINSITFLDDLNVLYE